MYSEAALRELIGTNLRQRRALLGLTLKTASERASVHWRVWKQIEAGERDALISTLARMAEAVEVNVSDLLKEPTFMC